MSVHDPTTGEPDPALADELFGLVEEAQGYAFISDGIDVLSAKEIVELARNSLSWTNETARLLRRFLQKHHRAARAVQGWET